MTLPCEGLSSIGIQQGMQSYQILGRRGLLVGSTTGSSLLAWTARRLLLDAHSLSSGQQTAYIIVSILLVIVAGLSSGLTLGLLSLDRVDLQVIKRTGTQRQQWLVHRVEPLLRNPHFLLVSLLLCNAAAYEALPIFLDRLLNPLAAILISVTAILAFGEILPQATCKRYGLHIGAYCSWLVRLIMLMSFPISWPIGKLLDWLLGSDTALFQRPELRAFVSLHGEGDQDGGESVLSAGEVQVIHGAMDMAHKTAETAMTPLSNVFSVDADAVLSRKLLNRIVHAGHSRVPVYEHGDRKNIIGLILVKELLLADTSREQRVRACLVRDVDYIRADTPLYTVMELFRMKRRHMAVLTRAPDENDQSTPHQLDVIGIITIEDVIEELLHFEIVDETDVYIDNLQTAPVATHPWRDVPPELAKYILLTRHKRLPNLSREERSFSKNLQGVVSSRCGPKAVIAVASYHTEMVSLKAGRSKSAGLLEEANLTGVGLGSETSSEMELRPESSTARPGSDVR